MSTCPYSELSEEEETRLRFDRTLTCTTEDCSCFVSKGRSPLTEYCRSEQSMAEHPRFVHNWFKQGLTYQDALHWFHTPNPRREARSPVYLWVSACEKVVHVQESSIDAIEELVDWGGEGVFGSSYDGSYDAMTVVHHAARWRREDLIRHCFNYYPPAVFPSETSPHVGPSSTLLLAHTPELFEAIWDQPHIQQKLTDDRLLKLCEYWARDLGFDLRFYIWDLVARPKFARLASFMLHRFIYQYYHTYDHEGNRVMRWKHWDVRIRRMLALGERIQVSLADVSIYVPHIPHDVKNFMQKISKYKAMSMMSTLMICTSGPRSIAHLPIELIRYKLMPMLVGTQIS